MGGTAEPRPRARSYRDYDAWKEAMALARLVYETTRAWPKDEQFGLTHQVRRAAVSIPSNIAEGQGRFGSAEWLHYLSIAHGSLCEIETQLLLAHQIGYMDEESLAYVATKAEEVGRLIRGLSRSIRS